MAIDLQSLSITSAFNSIVNYFRSQENNSTWRDLTNGSEGSFLIRLLANVMSVISYRIVAQSRENYLSTAALPASNIGIAVNLGYSVPRGSNLKRLIRLIPNGNYTIPKFSVLGSYNTEYSIICIEDEDITLVEGQPINIQTVVGNLREESFITGTSDIKIFTLFNSNISDDFMLFKDGMEVPTTTTLKGMLDNNYLVRTNPYSSVDIAFLNTLETADENLKYGNGSEITIRYVELANVPVVPYSSSMFTYGTLDDYRTIQGNRGMETVDSIKVTAPLYHEVQNLIRSKSDYASALRIDVPSVSEVNFKALTPTYTQITYLKDNFNLLTGTYQPVGSSLDNKNALVATEIGDFLNLLKDQNYFGTPLPDIVVPRREEAYLRISVALKNKYKNISDVDYDIENILKNFYNVYLNVSFNTYELERKIEDLSYVKYARVEHIINDRNPNAYCQLGYLTYDEDSKNYYKISNVLGVTGTQLNSSLNWRPSITVEDAIDTNAVFQDGALYWKCYKKLPGVSMRKRYPNSTFGLGEFMHTGSDNPALENFMFKCIDMVRYSGTVKPDVTTAELGDFIEDGGLVWVVIDRVSDPTITEWESSKQYRIGQRVNASGDYFSLECVAYAGRTSSSSTPAFFKDVLPINTITQEADPFATVTVEGNYAQYFKEGDVVTAEYTNTGGSGIAFWEVQGISIYNSDENITTFKVVNYDKNLGSLVVIEGNKYTNVYPVFRYSIDGDVAWELVEDPTNIQYGWDSFISFKHEVEILEA